MYGYIYNIDKNTCHEATCETRGPEYEENFTRLICELITENLKINYSDRHIVENLLFSALYDKLNGYKGLLNQYLHSQLDIIARTFKREFGIEEEIRADNYATHAKFNTLIEKIKEKVNEPKQVRDCN